MAALQNVGILVPTSQPQQRACGDSASDTFVGDFGVMGEVSVADGVLVIGDSDWCVTLFLSTVHVLIQCTGASRCYPCCAAVFHHSL